MKSIKHILSEISLNFNTLAETSVPQIEEASKLMLKTLKNGGKIMFCGNGGSASDAQHLSAELVGRYMKNRKPLASVSLTTDTSIITAISNDFTFDDVFSRQVESIGNEGDLLYAISTSSRSKNVINALKVAKKNEYKNTWNYWQ